MYVHEVVLKEKLQQAEIKIGAVADKAGKRADSDAGAVLSVLQGIYAIKEGSVSKVVDENGEPMVVYHGTDVDFSIKGLKTSGGGTMDFPKDFDNDAWVKKLLAAKTTEEMNAVFAEFPLTPEEKAELASMTGDDPDYWEELAEKKRKASALMLWEDPESSTTEQQTT